MKQPSKPSKAKPNIDFDITFLCPRYWGIWLGISVLWVVHLLPFNAQYQVGKLLGKLLYLVGTKRKRLAAYNINLCFPDLDRQQQKKLLKAHFNNLGLGVIETAIVWWGSHRTNPKNANEKLLVNYIGLENIEKAIASGRGVMLLTPHFTNLEMTGLFISFITKYHPVYRPHNNALMDYLIKKGRAIPTFNDETGELEAANPISNSDTRQMLKVLKRGEHMILLPDQRYRSKNRVEVPFFGHLAKSNPATSKIAQLTNCVVIPTFTRRTDKLNYEVEFKPALENFPGESNIEDTVRLHELYETEIKNNPAQYLWVHNRWDIKNY